MKITSSLTPRSARSCVGILLAVWLPAMAPPYAAAQQTVSFSPDITVVLGGQTLDDEDAANDDLAGVITPIDVGALPGAADLQAYHRGGPGVGELLVLDTTVALPGGVTATPRKVIAFSGGAYSEALDLSACGLPAGVKIDAMTSGDTMWFSFDTPVSLGGVLHDDEDVVALGAGCAWAQVLDGSAAGIPVGLDLDGLHYQKGTGLLMMSFDGAGTADLAAPVGTLENSRPATAGDHLTVWANGLGPVESQPPIADGHNSCEPDGVCLDDGSNIVLHPNTMTPIIRIGGVEVPEENVLFSGLSVGSVGANEVVFEMPPGMPTGPEVPLTIEIGGVISKEGVTMAVE